MQKSEIQIVWFKRDLRTIDHKPLFEASKTLKPILSEYSEKNSISMVLQKQNVVIGKKELDITKDIIIILNEKIKKIDIN